MIPREIITLSLTCVVVIGCSSNPGITPCKKASLDRTSRSNSPAEETAITQSQFKKNTIASLGSLYTRNCIIRLETGGKLSILEPNGNLLALSLSKAEFQDKFPQLYNAYETAIAGGKAEDIIIDARIFE